MNTREIQRSSDKPRKKMYLAGIAVLTCLVIGFVLIHGIHRVDPKRVEAEIALNVPVGADINSVIRFLDSQNIRHTDYLPKYHRIYAEIKRSTVGLIVGHIHIEFNFDENGKLVSHEVKELFDFL